MSGKFPSQRKDIFIEVFCAGRGTQPFICGADGHITIDTLQEIEDALIIEMDVDEYTTFEKGDGTYLFKAHHEPADEGTYAYWEVEEVAFEPLPAPDLGEDDRYGG